MENSFYQALYINNEFVSSIGKLTMSSAKLESSIKDFITATGYKPYEKATLGILIKRLTDAHKIDLTTSEHLHFICEQRNYFVHRLHSSLSEYPSNAFELSQFLNRTNALCSEMEFFSKVISEASKDLTINPS